MGKRLAQNKGRWESFGWWARTHLDTFSPLLTFANTKIEEINWASVLWNAMGKERTYVATSRKDASTVKIFAANIGDGEDFENIRLHIPKIIGQETTREMTAELQDKARQILDKVVATLSLVDRQRHGEDEAAWKGKVKQRDLTFKLSGYQSDYANLPWSLTHSEEYMAVLDHIREALKVPETRKAVIHSSIGFVCFEDAGEDAAITLGWMLMGLIDVVFEKERAVLRKCRFCENYFAHETLKHKECCSATCRYRYHNYLRKLAKG